MEFYVLNKEFEAVALVDAYTSAIWTDRFYEAGDFEIQLPASKDNIDIFQKDYYLWFANSEHLMIIGEVSTDSDAETGQIMTVAGDSLEFILDRRIIWKNTTVSGNLQQGVKKLLNENIISPSDSARKVSNLSFEESTDTRITSLTLENQYLGDNLYEVISEICKNEDIGFKITMPEDGKFVFKLYSGEDRSYDQETNPWIVFSPNYDNLLNSNSFESNRSYKNVALVAGETTDDNGSRKFITVSSENVESGLYRRETFVDAGGSRTTVNGEELSDSEYNAQLQQKGKEELADNKITKTFDGEAESTRSWQYRTDFYMGDIVQVENEFEQQSKARITEFIWSQDESENTQYPTFTIIEDKEGGN